MSRQLAMLALAGVALALGVAIERHEASTQLREALRPKSVPTAILASGKLGRRLRNSDLIRLDSSEFEADADASQSPLVFRTKRAGLAGSFVASPAGSPPLPSSTVVSDDHFEDEWALVSIVTDDANLNSAETGIFANKMEHGAAWERPAFFSYFADKELKFSTGVGIRLHGASSRHRKTQKRVRVYFRNRYGADSFAAGPVLGAEAQPLRTLVVRTDDLRFSTPLASDIARRIGALSSLTHPVVFLLNGQVLGKYYLIEHQSRRQWKSHLGHDDFVFYRFKSGDQGDPFIHSVSAWAGDLSVPMTMKSAEERVDLDNLSRHLLSLAFTATNDWPQGAIYYDKTEQTPRLRFINWDMDHAFVDYGPSWAQGTRPTWQQETFEQIFTDRKFRERGSPSAPIDRGDLRAIIFTRLWKDSPQYRQYFVRLAMDVLNHRLDQKFLMSRVTYYRDQLGLQFPEEREEFLVHRAEWMRKGLTEFFEAGIPHKVSVAGLEETPASIDGFPWSRDYEGTYFAGTTLRLAPLDKEASGKGWTVNGKVHSSDRLEITVDQDLTIVRL